MTKNSLFLIQGDDTGNTWYAGGQGSGFIKNQNIDVPSKFQVLATFNENAAFGGIAH